MADYVQIVGIKSFPSSKNPRVIYYNYYFTTPFTDYEMQNSISCLGVAADKEFATVDIGCYVGDIVELKYTKGFQDKAQLVGCTIIKPGIDRKAPEAQKPDKQTEVKK